MLFVGGTEFPPNTLAIRKGKRDLVQRRENVYTSGFEYVYMYVCVCVCANVCIGGGIIKELPCSGFFFFHVGPPNWLISEHYQSSKRKEGRLLAERLRVAL